MKVIAILVLGCLSCATAGIAVADQQTIPVTVELTPAQHAVLTWAIAQTTDTDGDRIAPPRPATIELYLQQLIRTALRPDERAKRIKEAKASDADRRTLADRLSKLTVAQCLRISSELGVTTDKLPCGRK